MIQQVKAICDIFFVGVCWASAAAWLTGVVQPIIVILSASASFLWIGIQIFDWFRKRKQSNEKKKAKEESK